MTSSHISITLSDSGRNGQITVFTIHVVGSGTRVISEPNTEILDFQRFLLVDLFNTDDFAGSFLEFPQLTQEIPETGRKKNSNEGKVLSIIWITKNKVIKIKLILTVLKCNLPRFSNDWAGSKDSHPVQWSLGLLFSRQFTSDDTELPERSLCFHLDIIIFHLFNGRRDRKRKIKM